MLGQGIAVQRFTFEGLENHHLQGSGKKIALLLYFHYRHLNKALSK